MEKVRRFKGEMKEAWETAGWRERFAIDNGNKTIVYMNGHNVYGLHIPGTKNIRMQTGRFMTQ